MSTKRVLIMMSVGVTSRGSPDIRPIWYDPDDIRAIEPWIGPQGEAWAQIHIRANTPAGIIKQAVADDPGTIMQMCGFEAVTGADVTE